MTTKPNYSIAGGIKKFEAAQVKGGNAIIDVHYNDIDTDDVELFVEISSTASDEEYAEPQGHRQVVNKSESFHQFVVSGLPAGAWIRVGVDPKTAAAGVINKINTLV